MRDTKLGEHSGIGNVNYYNRYTSNPVSLSSYYE